MCNSSRITIIAGITFALVACKVGPDFKSPAAPHTQSYTNAPVIHQTTATPGAGNAGSAQYLMAGQDIPAYWWRLFHSATLNRLIVMGLANSPTLDAAKATLRQAQALLQVQTGNLLLPAVGLQLGATRNQVSGLQSGITGAPPTLFNVYNASVNASYNIDVFGGARRQVEAASAQVDYARYQLLAAYLTLTANIVTTTITIASLEDQIQAVQSLVAEETEQLIIVKKQLKVGGASVENVLTQETTLAQTESLLPPLQKSLALSEQALAVLVGELPSQLPTVHINLETLYLPTHLPISLPARLVQQRPDVAAASAQLHVASANIGVATANLLPQISLSAGYGYVSSSVSNLFTLPNSVWNIASQLLQPIFHGGALLAQRRANVAAYQAAFADYRQTVLQAFKEVADALRAIQIDAYEFKAQKKAEIAARATWRMVNRQFQLGGKNYLDVLVAQNQYQQARLNRIKAQALRFNDTAALFQALGGGWWQKGYAVP